MPSRPNNLPVSRPPPPNLSRPPPPNLSKSSSIAPRYRPPLPYSKFQKGESREADDEYWEDDDWDDDDDDDDTWSMAGTPVNTTASYGRDTISYSTVDRVNRNHSQIQKVESKTGTYNPFNNFAHFTKIGGDAYLLGSYGSTLPSNSDCVIIIEGPDGFVNRESYVCSVKSPKKETKYHGIKTFTTYQLTPSFSGIQVSRRYNHFNWLQHRLCSKYPTLAIPPMPDRQFVGRFEESFVNERLQHLQVWIDRICQHPVVANSETFMHFLTCTNKKVWSEVKRRSKKDENAGARFFLTVQGPPMDSKQAEIRIEKFQRFVKVFDESLKHLTNTGEQNLKKYERSFGKQFQKLGSSFTSLSKSFELDERQNSQNLIVAISNTGKAYEDIGQLFVKQPTNDIIPLLEGIQEYRGLLSCFHGSITMHKAATSKIGGEKAAGLSEVELKAIEERANVVSATVIAEIQHFNLYRCEDFKNYMETYLQKQIEFYHEVASRLEGTLKLYQKA